jgi:hypothetical protein
MPRCTPAAQSGCPAPPAPLQCGCFKSLPPLVRHVSSLLPLPPFIQSFVSAPSPIAPQVVPYLEGEYTVEQFKGDLRAKASL